VAEKMGIDTSDIVSNEDLLEDNNETSSSLLELSQTSNSSSTASNLQLFDPDLEEQLSSREINLAKRRARKQKLREAQSLEAKESSSSSSSNNGPNSKRLKREDSVYADFSPESWSIYSVGEGQWPLSAWVDILINDIFSPMWEVRHGAATALREVIKLHGNGGGREPWMTNLEVIITV
jgi:TATA-binding protein-associated factor